MRPQTASRIGRGGEIGAPEFWRPIEEGDSLWGVIEGPAQTGQSDAYGEYEYYTLGPVLLGRTRGGRELPVEPFRNMAVLVRTSLADKLSDVMVGKTVYLEYSGDVPSRRKEGAPAKIINVFLTSWEEFRAALMSAGGESLLPAAPRRPRPATATPPGPESEPAP